MTIEKRGMRMDFSFEALKPPAGKYVPYNMTSEEVKARSRTKKLLKELRSNPWIVWGYDGPELMGRKTRQWIPEE